MENELFIWRKLRQLAARNGTSQIWGSSRLLQSARSSGRRKQAIGSGSLGYEAFEPRQLLAVVASYSVDFPAAGEGLTDGWSYSWNAPENGDDTTGAIEDPTTRFLPLQYTGIGTNWSADGDLSPSTDINSAYVRLAANGGHPGVARVTGLGVPRYTIASFTVSESGFYEIDDSFIGLAPASAGANTDGVAYRVFLNRDEPLVSGIVGKDARRYFDAQLGFLVAGDQIHVAFGANGNQAFDFFTTDFSILRDQQREQVVGQFRDDFAGAANNQALAGEPGWSYWWNSPSNWESGSPYERRSSSIGDSLDYERLRWTGDQWTADGDDVGTNSSPDFFLRLNDEGGKPGNGFVSAELPDRYAIAAFTVPHSGLYGITDSFLSVTSDSLDGIELYVHFDEPTDEPVKRLIAEPGSTRSFDTELGYLKQGSTVYFAFGANGNHIRDRFQTDFSIVRSLPRAEPDLSPLMHDREVIDANEPFGSVPGAVPNDHLDDWLAIDVAINRAVVRRAGEVVLAPGTYNLASSSLPTASTPYFEISGAQDLVINGNGAHLILDDYTRPLFVARLSNNLIFRNFTIDYAERVPARFGETADLYKPLTFTQGKITSVDAANQSFTIRVNTDAFVAPDATFVNTNGINWGYAVDPSVDGRLKAGSRWHYLTQAIAPGNAPNEFRVQAHRVDGLEVGDRYVLQRRTNNAMFGFYNRSNNITVMDVTAYTAPSVFVGSVSSSSINVISSDVKIRPDDWPGVPDTQRWKSINGDGVHIQNNRVGAWVEDSTFEGLGDDVMNFYSRPMTIVERSGSRQFTLGAIRNDRLGTLPNYAILPGDHLAFYEPLTGELLKEAQVASVRVVPIQDPLQAGTTLYLLQVTMDQDIPATTLGNRDDAFGLRDETSVFHLDAMRHSIVQDSQLLNSRRYGNFLMSDDVQLIDNLYEGLSDEAVAGHNEPGWPLGLFSSNVLIQGNKFVNNGFSARFLQDDFHSGTVAFQAARLLANDDPSNLSGLPNHRVDEAEYTSHNLQIRDNEFYQWRKPAISIRNSSSVTIANNWFSEPQVGLEIGGETFPSQSLAPIDVFFSQDIEVHDNVSLQTGDLVNQGTVSDFEESGTQTVWDGAQRAWLKFDAGQAFADSSGNSIRPQFNGAGIAQGRFGLAPIFNTTNSISLNDRTASDVAQRTISFWFNAKQVQKRQILFAQGDQDRGLNVYLEDGFLILGAWSDAEFETFLRTPVAAAGWNHVGLVLDASLGKLRGYLNGSKFAVGNAGVITNPGGRIVLAQNGIDGTRSQSELVSVGVPYGFAGVIDDLRIFGRAVGDGEMRGLAAS